MIELISKPKQRLLMRFERVHPVLRLAHRLKNVLIVPKRIIYDHELVFISEGRTTLLVDGQTIDAPEDTLLIIPPFVPHAFESRPDEVSVHTAIHFDFCAGTPPRPNDSDDIAPYEIIWPAHRQMPLIMTLTAQDGIARGLTEIIALTDSHGDDPLALSEAATLLQMILLKILRRPPASEAASERGSASDAAYQVNRRRVGAAMDYIRVHLSEPIHLNDLAETASMSRSRFVTLFREFSGESPQQYVQNRRIALARRLLSQPDLSIKEIAAQAGFEDSFYFSRVFRRADGLTPSQYRAAALAGRFPSLESIDAE